jgi:hypothetical protein
MLQLVVFLLLFFLLFFLSQSVKESIDATIPVSFPRTDVIQLPERIVQGKLDVRGPVLLGIEGTGADLTYLEANGSQLSFNSAGYDKSTDAVLYTNENDMNVKAGAVVLDAAVQTGVLNANRASATFMQVNRTDADRYPNWGSGIHTWDLYANGSVGAGNEGNVAAWLNSNGDMACNGTANLNMLYGQNLTIQNVNILSKIDELRQFTQELNQRIDARNAERRRREQEARNRNNRGGGGRRCSIM